MTQGFELSPDFVEWSRIDWQQKMRRSYYYTLDSGTANFLTVCFTEGKKIGEFLRFRNLDSTDMADLEQLEVDLRLTHAKMGKLANEYHALAKEKGQYVERSRFEATDFDDHYAVSGTRALQMERELSIQFITMMALAAGVEDRIARITIRLHDQDSRMWQGLPRHNPNEPHSRPGKVRNWLRRQSGLDQSKLREILDNRNRAVHERYYYANVIEEDGIGDVLFTPAMNPQELTSPFPTYRVTQLARDVKWLIEVYLDWWCKESVRQIETLGP